jgi:AGCS family alanine or glycine:cation symporter
VKALESVIFHEFGGFPALIIILMCTGLFFSLYLGFPSIVNFRHALKEITKDSEKDGGLLKSKQSLFTSLSSVVGMGSIAGIASMICFDAGPGAVLWLAIMVIFGMNTSFAETLLAVKYRNVDMEKKSIDCAPVMYIKKSFAEMNLTKLGLVLSVIYGAMYFIGLLGAQIYQVKEATNLLTGFKSLQNAGTIITIVFAAIISISVLGGITGVAKILEKLLPIACGSYLVCVFIILIFNIRQLPLALLTILKEAFRPKAMAGGIVGVMSYGIQRGTYCNEAGLGSATTPYTAMESDNPVKIAGLGSMNPLFVGAICLATGLMVVSSGVHLKSAAFNGSGILSVMNVFVTTSRWLGYMLCAVIPMLTLSLCISSASNAQNVYRHYFGRKTNILFILICFGVIALSAFIETKVAMDVADILYLSIAIPNIFCLFMSRKIIKDFYKTNRDALLADSK